MFWLDVVVAAAVVVVVLGVVAGSFATFAVGFAGQDVVGQAAKRCRTSFCQTCWLLQHVPAPFQVVVLELKECLFLVLKMM